MSTKIFIVLATGILLAILLVYSPSPQPKPTLPQTLDPEPALSSTQASAPAKTTGPLPLAPPPRPQTGQFTNLLARLLNDDSSFRLTPQQVESFLRENQRSAESLLAAARVTGDPSFLREALEKYPGDPRVNYAAVFDRTASPQERRQRIENFKQAAPDNALAHYVSAQAYFESGQPEAALQEFGAGCAAASYDDYAGQFVQNAEEAYRSAGYPEAEAKALAALGLPLPYLVEMKRLGQNLADLASTYRQNGGDASAQALIQNGVSLAQQVSQNGGQNYSMLNSLVGIAIERKVLEGLDPSSPYDPTGRTVQDRLRELLQTREDLKQIGKQTEGLLATFSPSDVISFFDRMKISGEAGALQWALNRQVQR